VAIRVARKATEAMMADLTESAFGGYSEVKRSVLYWCIWPESGFGRREEIFAFNLFFKDIL
jgi:hypothetical protein